MRRVSQMTHADELMAESRRLIAEHHRLREQRRRLIKVYGWLCEQHQMVYDRHLRDTLPFLARLRRQSRQPVEVMLRGSKVTITALRPIRVSETDE